jgi:transcription antitermination factor NusG
MLQTKRISLKMWKQLGDMRKKGKWLIIELSENCRIGEQVSQVASEIKSAFGKDAIYFIPVRTEKIKERDLTNVLFDGYVFVNCPSEEYAKDGVYNLCGSCLQRPLSERSKLTFITDRDIESFKKSMEASILEVYPDKGAIIIPRSGTFKDMEGEVLSINKPAKTVLAIFKTLSREVTAHINILNIAIKNE